MNDQSRRLEEVKEQVERGINDGQAPVITEAVLIVLAKVAQETGQDYETLVNQVSPDRSHSLE
jgi:hypothetical protein